MRQEGAPARRLELVESHAQQNLHLSIPAFKFIVHQVNDAGITAESHDSENIFMSLSWDVI